MSALDGKKSRPSVARPAWSGFTGAGPDPIVIEMQQTATGTSELDAKAESAGSSVEVSAEPSPSSNECDAADGGSEVPAAKRTGRVASLLQGARRILGF